MEHEKHHVSLRVATPGPGIVVAYCIEGVGTVMISGRAPKDSQLLHGPERRLLASGAGRRSTCSAPRDTPLLRILLRAHAAAVPTRPGQTGAGLRDSMMHRAR